MFCLSEKGEGGEQKEGERGREGEREICQHRPQKARAGRRTGEGSVAWGGNGTVALETPLYVWEGVVMLSL